MPTENGGGRVFVVRADWPVLVLFVPVLGCGAMTHGPRIPDDCTAPDGIEREVTLLLQSAAAHGSASHACADGSVELVTVDSIRACAKAEREGVIEVAAFYRMGTELERKAYSARLLFRWTPDGFRLDVPKRIPGMDDFSTPLDEKHDGDCLGSSEPFVAIPVNQ